MPRVNSMPSVTLYIRITDQKGRRHYERVNRRNPQTGGIFCLHYFNPEGKRRWLTVGRDINQALEARFKKESDFRLQQKEGSMPAPAQPKTLGELRDAFLHDKQTTFKKDGSPLDPDTISSYEKVTREFLDIVKHNLPSEITRQDLRDWIGRQRERVSHRTVCNRYISIACFLHFCEVDHKKLLPQNERPTPVEETPEAYSRQEIDKFFFNVVRERDALAFELYLKAGPRERELTHLEWSDLHLGPEPVVHFRTKQDFRTKTGKSRVVPLERSLAAKLAEWRLKNPTSRYVFGAHNGVPERHFLRIAKKIAKRAGMDPENFWLQKFRDTFATWALRRGVDIRTVQHWMGHESIEMTMRYLAPEQGERAQSQINQAFGGFDVTAESAACEKV
jgi:integrase/recombinase XerD